MEIETKVLEVDSDRVKAVLAKLGAKPILDTQLVIDWYRLPGVTEETNPWFLRIRRDSSGEAEITWKGLEESAGIARSQEELNVKVGDLEKGKAILTAIGLEHYAHQEKYRQSWTHENWRFELDQYPGVPPYLEIEGESEDHIHQAIELIGLAGHKTTSSGERVLIQKEYGLDWYDMRFDTP